MKKIYEHRITNGDHAEAISVESNAESVRIAVSDIADMDSEEEVEHITSIDLPPNAVMPFVEALLQSINEINHADMPCNSIETLTAELDAWIRVPLKINKD